MDGEMCRGADVAAKPTTGFSALRSVPPWQMAHTSWPAVWMSPDSSGHSINPLVIWPCCCPDSIEDGRDVVLMYPPGSDAEADPTIARTAPRSSP